MFVIVAGVAVLAFVPATALAQRHHGRHHTHHARRTRKFGNFSDPASPTTATATVTSFDPTTGKLVITLADGTTTETATVTSDTQIECQASQQMGEDIAGDGPGDSGGNNSGDDDQGEDQGGGSCSTTNLTVGAKVLAGAMQFDSTGAVWDRIELAPSGTTGTVSTGDDDGGD
jgi:hypothetical protein